MKKFITSFLVLIISMISVSSYAEDQPQPPKSTTQIIKVYKKRFGKTDLKPIPGKALILECTIENNEIIFHPSFWEEGMAVRISDDNGSEWSDVVTIEEPAMFFDGQTGTFEIECITIDGTIFAGEFEL